MSEVRRDPLTGREVVLQPDRIPPPPAFGPGTLPRVAACPFCPGAEAQTGHTLGRRPLEGPWHARAFPNRRPGLKPELTLSRDPGPLERWTGVGAHEVIVESRNHDRPDLEDQVRTLALANERMRDLTGDPRFQAIGWYRNRYLEAGSTQPHPHSQVVATPHVPRLLDVMAEVQLQDPGCLLDQVERATAGDRLLIEHDGVVAFTPWAPLVAHEVWIVPTVATPYLWDSDPRAVATVLEHVEARLDGLFERCARNVVLYQAPRRRPQGFCWHLRVLPRLTRIAAFEHWTGGGMHPLQPETSAALLRGVVS